MSNDPLKGLADVLGNLSKLGERIEKQALRSGLTAAAGVVRDEARQNAPKASGKLAKAIRSGSPRRNSDGTFSIRVVVDTKKPDGFLGNMFEYGIAQHLIARTAAGEGSIAISKAKAGKGKVRLRPMKIGDDFVSGIISHPGVAAHPFLRPALDTKQTDAIAAFRSKIVAVVEGKTGLNLEAGQTEGED